ncbi:6212_t:CDS:2, partial [Racocetra persica]
SKSEAKDLLCIFAFLSTKHPNSDLLKRIEKCKEGKWRNASAPAATKKLTKLAKYFPELASLLDSMDSYSLCEPEKKRLKFSNDDEPQVSEKTFVDFGTQVERTFVDFGTQVERTFVDFGTQVERTFVNFGTQVERTFIDFGTQVERTFIDFSTQVDLLKKKACADFGSQ